MKCSGKHDTTWTFSRSIMFSPLHFMLYRGKWISFGTVHVYNFILQYCAYNFRWSLEFDTIPILRMSRYVWGLTRRSFPAERMSSGSGYCHVLRVVGVTPATQDVFCTMSTPYTVNLEVLLTFFNLGCTEPVSLDLIQNLWKLQEGVIRSSQVWSESVYTTNPVL